MLRLVVFLMIIITVVTAVLGAILIASGWFSASSTDVGLGCVLVAVPVALLFAVRRVAVRQGLPAFRSALENFAADHDGWYFGSGLAISGVRREILVAGPSSQRTYSYDDFVGVRHALTRDVFYDARGPLAVVLVMIALVRIIVGYFTDGMFLQFRDGSSWQIIGVRTKEAEVWADRLGATRRAVEPAL